MEEPLRFGQLRFRVHGRVGLGTPDHVLASVFARKMSILIQAINAADAAVNSRVGHDYFIRRLSDGSATVEIEERKRPKIRKRVSSGIDAFDLCIRSINDGQFERTKVFGRCANYIPPLARGAAKDFSYGELWIGGQAPLRVDALLEEQGHASLAHESALTMPEAPSRQWFAGTARGNFVGHLLETDFRGALPSGVLVLSAGGKEVDCIFHEKDIDEIRSSLRKRVRVEGRVRYDGRSGFPRRIEVERITPTKENAEFSKWSGSFSPFEREEWEPA